VKKYFKKLISLDAVRAKKLCIYFQDRFDIINVGNLDGPTDYISLKRIEEPTVGGGLGGLFEDFRNIEAGNALIMGMSKSRKTLIDADR
jgi:hypothetical protein